jgi:hypothetical protein
VGSWRTTSTGQWAWRTTESETLPSSPEAPEPAASQDDKVSLRILGKPHYLLVWIAERKMGVANLDPLVP